MRRLTHLAITPDGNRRYAKKHGLSFEQAYKAGFGKIKQVVEWSKEPEKITLWALSLDNFAKRSSFELKILYKLMQKYAEENIQNKQFVNEGIKVRFFGRRELLPKELNEKFGALESQTEEGKKELNIAVAYSGRDELLSAAKALALDAKSGKIDLAKIGENDFGKYLYYNETPDLVIRTGNAQRLSGLMPWQTAYSEIYFSKKLWPEFEKSDYDDAVGFYKNAESRKGR
jgi:tritrans,polycis-undecaprenyl-diphosphate synthase [geranylgeranyl-diphosphate specific]